MEILGIDIGGSGIKGAIVDTKTGEFTVDRYRILTPQPAKPEPVADVVAEIVKHFDWKGPLGCTFPAIIKKGVAYSAANVDDDWIGTDVASLVEAKTGCPTVILNDADAAGLAEVKLGAGRDKDGTVIVLTLGTGIGSAIFVDGVIVPNCELGHLEIDGDDAEHRASDKARSDEDLSWKKWGKRLNRYLQHVEFLFSPDLFIIGGGVSKKYEKYFPYIEVNAEIVPAQMRNQAGIVGAAMAASVLA